MNIKSGNFFFFTLLLIIIKTSDAAKKIVITRQENWNHPVIEILKKHDISLYKVSYSKDGTCPTFYAKFKYSPAPKVLDAIDYQKIYSEILKANFYFPYALVDEKEDLRINVGWKDKAKKIMVVDTDNASSISTCRGNSHAHTDDEEEFDKFKINTRMKKRIMRSSLKIPLRRGDSKQFIAYLYAEDEKNKPETDYDCDNKKEHFISKTGHYYLYLYDINNDSFFPGRIAIFQDYYRITMNIPGANYFALPGSNKSDVLLISQAGDCTGDKYEAYGFSVNQLFLKKYSFVSTKNIDRFYGKINLNIKDNRLVASGEYDSQEIQKMYLSVSDKPGEIQLQLAPCPLNKE